MNKIKETFKKVVKLIVYVILMVVVIFIAYRSTMNIVNNEYKRGFADGKSAGTEEIKEKYEEFLRKQIDSFQKELNDLKYDQEHPRAPFTGATEKESAEMKQMDIEDYGKPLFDYD